MRVSRSSLSEPDMSARTPAIAAASVRTERSVGAIGTRKYAAKAPRSAKHAPPAKEPAAK
jgi:hypothetical protein